MFKQFKLIDKTSSYKSSSSIAGVGVNSKNLSPEEYKSLIFNSGSSQYLNRTPASASNRKTWTWSGWVKRGAIDANRRFLFNSGAAGTDSGSFSFEFFSDYTIRVASGITQFFLSTPLYRDPSAWYHIVLSVNTTNLTTSDRIIVYVNGSRITTSSYTAPSTDLDTAINNNAAHFIGCYESGPSLFFNGYLTEINFIDGQALSSENFGYFDTIGIWQPRKYSGSYGINGFYLPLNNPNFFELAKDKSGNSNHWTLNGYSSSLASNVVVSDSPINNYATLNPLDTGPSSTLSNGNLSFTYTGGASHRLSTSTIHMSSGKWYWEGTYGQGGTAGSSGFGIAKQPINLSDSVGQSNAYVYHSNGNKYVNGSNSAFGATYTTGDIIGIAFNADTGELFGYKNGILQGTITTGLTTGPYFAIANSYNSSSWDLNFGQRPFAYAVPSGFKTLCTQNLPTPTIKKPSLYFDSVIYTGNNASRSITGLNFSPDLVWIKSRSASTWNFLFDAVRGATKWLASNQLGDEATNTTSLTSFDSGGFSLSTDPAPDTSTGWNANTSTYVAWAWDKSPIAGMDIVSYTGNGANRTIAHTLGVAPKMLIVKARTTAGADQGWPVWHTSIANTTYLELNSTSGTASGTNYWNSTSPTSSVFSVGTNAAVNTSADTYIAYAFAEVEGFSRFGSYDGNGSTDGPFVYCGFRPRWVMVKASSTGDAGYEWLIFDTARSDFNLMNKWLLANSNQAEITDVDAAADVIDGVSSGFKLRGSDSRGNANGVTYIFAAFAEAPFKYSRAR